jgi:dTDP-4-amino-4,6-dideoxygalactose transaminase
MPFEIPYFSFDKINSDIKEELSLSFREILDSEWYILGRHLTDFENEFAQYIGVRYAIGVGNGFDALRISLEALSLKKDDEIILPSLTFIATLLAVIQAGGRPVLADVDPDTFIMDYRSIESLIGPKTKAIIPVHLYGFPVDVPEIIRQTCNKEIVVIEDFAQSVGAEIGGEKTGSLGLINAASFYPTKTLGALGDGGIITTNDRKLAQKCRSLRNYGFTEKGQHELIGYNSRLDEIQAAILSKKIPWLDIWNNERRSLAEKYKANLSCIPGLELPDYDRNVLPAHHIFPVLCKKREALKKHLSSVGIETLVHYRIPLHRHSSMLHLGYSKGSMPVAEKISDMELSLPIYPGLSDDKVNYICEMIESFQRKQGGTL